MQLLIWLLITYGITNIIVEGAIFLPMRAKIRQYARKSALNGGSGFYNFLDQVISCQMCCGVWIGWGMGIFIWSPSFNYLEINRLFSWIFDGGMASGVICTVSIILNKIQQTHRHE